jgi:hypothetical protein
MYASRLRAVSHLRMQVALTAVSHLRMQVAVTAEYPAYASRSNSCDFPRYGVNFVISYGVLCLGPRWENGSRNTLIYSELCDNIALIP